MQKKGIETIFILEIASKFYNYKEMARSTLN